MSQPREASAYWRNLNNFRGWVPVGQKQAVQQYVVCYIPGHHDPSFGTPSVTPTKPLNLKKPAAATTTEPQQREGSTGSNTSSPPSQQQHTAPSLQGTTNNNQSGRAHSTDLDDDAPPRRFDSLSAIFPPSPVATSAADRPQLTASFTLPDTGSPAAASSQVGHFCIAAKDKVELTRATKPMFSPSSRCADLCRKPKCNGSCSKFHIAAQDLEIMSIKGHTDPITVGLKQGRWKTLNPSDFEPTIGLYFTITLVQRKIVQSVYPWVCNRRLQGTCHNGVRCLKLHVAPSVLGDLNEEGSEVLEASVPLLRAVQQRAANLVGFQSFGDHLRVLQLSTIGDLQSMSENMFEAIMHRHEHAASDQQQFWQVLNQMRSFTADTPLATALMTFPGTSPDTLDKIRKSCEEHDIPAPTTVESLLTIKPKQFYSLMLPVSILDMLEKVRSRFDLDANNFFSAIVLNELEPNHFFNVMTDRITKFREKAHSSWRKKDPTRPIVTSSITYVNPDTCECSKKETSPTHRSRSGPSSATASPGAGAHTPNPQKDLSEIPAENHWCTCKRNFEIAVNYELSTPSGSRCSEQNVMGQLASKGLPTHCIREVFVHGTAAGATGRDPNPLFPCGVCENMFRRISKDVQKEHGQDVTLYMFDQCFSPKKLVVIPIGEISHREGSLFKRFIEEDVREE